MCWMSFIPGVQNGFLQGISCSFISGHPVGSHIGCRPKLKRLFTNLPLEHPVIINPFIIDSYSIYRTCLVEVLQKMHLPFLPTRLLNDFLVVLLLARRYFALDSPPTFASWPPLGKRQWRPAVASRPTSLVWRARPDLFEPRNWASRWGESPS